MNMEFLSALATVLTKLHLELTIFTDLIRHLLFKKTIIKEMKNVFDNRV